MYKEERLRLKKINEAKSGINNVKIKSTEKVNPGSLSSTQNVKYTNYERNYLAIGVGAGTNFAGLGGLMLQARLGGDRVGVGLHGSFGTIPYESIYFGGGVKFFFHRGGFIDFSYAKNIVYFDGYGDNRFLSVQVGWNFFFNNGRTCDDAPPGTPRNCYDLKSRFGMSLALGGSYNYEPYYFDSGYILPVGQIGFIYRMTGGTQKIK